ncbi:MAG: TetM/TetW/TetO/TetS family tetracycline resistance ribosomal protection protein [Oscillospiraceae bacterium]|jgi:ribosomal protection tetracycline resistance protein|nr:TetM/TetW/TetO/TetS family tetracycline resistance ribosomal protection protein [Oscillospiraceae bacterium]
MKTLNLGFLAHVDAGKTTTVERLLYLAGETRSVGSVDAGSARTDWLAVERERGISVRSACARLTVGDVTVNIVDTPGHADFAGEVERALSVLDAAVIVVSAAEGVQAQTEQYWAAARSLGLPCVFFINKIDRAGCDPNAVLDELRRLCSPFIVPVGQPSDCLYDIDDALAERYLNGDDITPRMLEQALQRQSYAARAFPCVFGASINGTGADTLLDTILRYLPSRELSPDGEPSGVIYKVEHDPRMGKFAHVRLFTGTLQNRDTPMLNDALSTDKIIQIRRINGSKHEDIGEVSGGDIAALCGLKNAKIGDIIGELTARTRPRLAAAVFSVRVMTDDAQLPALLKAVAELSDEDPLMAYEWNTDERELTVSVTGRIQIEILEYLLRERYNITAQFSDPTVIYKETATRTGVGFEAYTMPKPCWAIVELRIEPLSRGSGYQFESIAAPRDIAYRYQSHVETAVPDALKQGLYGWQVEDVKVTLTRGQHHHIHTHPLDFFLATPIAVMRALTDAGSTLLEPLVLLKLTADEGLPGKLIGDIIAMRGTFDSPVMSNGQVHIEATVPVATSTDYHARFMSLTSGRGKYNASFCGYAECALELGATAKRRGINPLDRDRWILAHRGALRLSEN